MQGLRTMNSDEGIRQPKGILKNAVPYGRDETIAGTQSFSSSRAREKSSYESSYADPRKMAENLKADAKMPASWELDLLMSVEPYDLTQELYKPMHLQESMSRKLENFANEKRAVLFKPLTVEEQLLLESREEEQKSEDSYGVTPGLEYFLFQDPHDRILSFLENAKVGDLVIGEYQDHSTIGLNLTLICFDGGKRAYLEDLGLKGMMPQSQVQPNLEYSSSSTYYIRCEILDVIKETKKIVLGTIGRTQTSEMARSFPLGMVSKDMLPRQYTLLRDLMRSRRPTTFEDLLQTSPGFSNPNSTGCVGQIQGLFSNRNSLLVGLRNPFPKKDMAADLRNNQNMKWAQYNVQLGVRHFKQGNEVEAFQCLNKAIMIDPTNAEGLVARGALHGNKGSYERALEDLELALKVSPEHFNGRKYTSEILFVYGKGHLQKGKTEEAIGAFDRMVDVIPESKDALFTLLSLHDEVRKVDTLVLPPLGVRKFLELQEKLKRKIAEEFAKKRLSYYENDTVALEGPSKRINDSYSDVSSRSSPERSGSEKQMSETAGKKLNKRVSDWEGKETSPTSKSDKLVRSHQCGTSHQDSRPSFEVHINEDGRSRSRKRSKEGKKAKKRSKEKRRKRKKDSSSSASSRSRTRSRTPREDFNLEVEFFQMETELAARFTEDERQQRSNDEGKASSAVRTFSGPAPSFNPSLRYTTNPAQDHSTLAVPAPNSDRKSVNTPIPIIRTIQNDAATRIENTVKYDPYLPTSVSALSAESFESAQVGIGGKSAVVPAAVPVSKWRAFGAPANEGQQPVTLPLVGTVDHGIRLQPNDPRARGDCSSIALQKSEERNCQTAPAPPILSRKTGDRSRRLRSHSESTDGSRSPTGHHHRYRSSSRSDSRSRSRRRRSRSSSRSRALSRSNSRSRRISQTRSTSRRRRRSQTRSNSRTRSRSQSRSRSRRRRGRRSDSRSQSRSRDRSPYHARSPWTANNTPKGPIKIRRGGTFDGYLTLTNKNTFAHTRGGARFHGVTPGRQSHPYSSMKAGSSSASDKVNPSTSTD